MSVQLMYAFMREILTDLKATDAALDDCIMKLFKNNVALSPDMVVGAFEEADFAGYAVPTEVVWGTPYIDDDNNAVMVGDQKTFVATGDTPVNTIYGYYITTTAGVLKYAERLETPVVIAATGEGLTVVPKITLGQTL